MKTSKVVRRQKRNWNYAQQKKNLRAKNKGGKATSPPENGRGRTVTGTTLFQRNRGTYRSVK